MAKIRAYLTLVGEDFDVDQVSLEIGMTPDEVRHKDERLGNGSLFGHTEWGIETELKKSDEVEPVLRELFSRINCDPVVLKEVGLKFKAEWHLLILVRIYDEDMPVLFFPADIIQFAAQIGAQIGFDTYLLWKGGE